MSSYFFKPFFLTLSISIALLGLSCNSDKNNNSSSDIEASLYHPPKPKQKFKLNNVSDSAVYVQRNVAKQIDPVFKDSEQKTQIKISYPYIKTCKHSAVKDSINAIILELLLLNTTDEIAFGSLEERLASFIREYELAKSEMEKELVLPSSWTCEVRIDVILNTDQVMALRFYEMNYTGGVHANSFTRYFNFNMTDASMLQLEDILSENYKTELLRVAEDCFKKTMNIKATTPISATAYEFPNNKFLLPRNFAITATGLKFCFNPYDIGPYSMGTIEFEVPFDKILSILKQETLI